MPVAEPVRKVRGRVRPGLIRDAPPAALPAAAPRAVLMRPPKDAALLEAFNCDGVHPMNYPLLPADAAQHAWQIACYAVTLMMAMISWIACAR